MVHAAHLGTGGHGGPGRSTRPGLERAKTQDFNQRRPYHAAEGHAHMRAPRSCSHDDVRRSACMCGPTLGYIVL